MSGVTLNFQQPQQHSEIQDFESEMKNWGERRVTLCDLMIDILTAAVIAIIAAKIFAFLGALILVPFFQLFSVQVAAITIEKSIGIIVGGVALLDIIGKIAHFCRN